jgi:hypothetical protein
MSKKLPRFFHSLETSYISLLLLTFGFFFEKIFIHEILVHIPIIAAEFDESASCFPLICLQLLNYIVVLVKIPSLLIHWCYQNVSTNASWMSIIFAQISHIPGLSFGDSMEHVRPI